MSIKNLQLEFFYENKPFTELGISPLYVFSSPEINPSNLEQFFRKSTEIKSIKERIKKNETQRKNYKGDTNRDAIYNSTILELFKTLNNLVVESNIEELTWDKISTNISKSGSLKIFQDKDLTEAFLTFLTTSAPLTTSNDLSKDFALANSKFIVNLFIQSPQSRTTFKSGNDTYYISLFKIIEDSFQILGKEYYIKLEIEFKKIVVRQTIQFKINFTGDIMTQKEIDFKPQYSIKDLPSQYSKIYFDKRYRFKKEELMGFSNILARLKISTPIEYEKFKDFKDIKEIFVIDKNLDKFLEDKKIETDDKFDNNIDNNITLISKVFFDPDFYSGFFSRKSPLYFYYNGKQYQIINYKLDDTQKLSVDSETGSYKANVSLHILSLDTPVTLFRRAKSLCPMQIEKVNKLSQDLGLDNYIHIDNIAEISK